MLGAEKQWQKVLSQLTPRRCSPWPPSLAAASCPPGRAHLPARPRAGQERHRVRPAAIQHYTQTQNHEKLLAETLRLVQQDEKQLPFVRNMLQNALKEEKDFDALEKLLISATQQHPEQAAYSELLLWLQVQRRDFAGALIQARALDRRGRSQGSRVMDLAPSRSKTKTTKAPSRATST
jgi:lipopolysaccharide biosynthesis regulator YciM